MDEAEVIRMAEAKGWDVRKMNGGHVQMRSPDGIGIVHASSTPGDRRSVDNLVSDLRKNGLDIPHRGNGGFVYPKGAISNRVDKLFKDHPERVWSISDVKAVVRSSMPGAALDSLDNSYFHRRVESGFLSRIGPGAYKLSKQAALNHSNSNSHPDITVSASSLGSALHTGSLTVIPLEEPAPVQAQQPSTPPLNTDEGYAADLEELDAALEALSRIEALVRKHRTVLQQVAQLKKVLNGGLL